MSELRVAMTLEQCWHRVPGGTAVAALALARALAARPGLELVGVAARHRALPPPPWTPPVETRFLPLPRVALYESWHVLRRPPVERATGRVDVVHATGIAMPPRSAPIVLTVHDLAFLEYPSYFSRAGLRFFRQALRLAVREADVVLCSSLATLAHCRAVGFEEERLRHVPLGVETRRADAAEVDRVRGRYGLRVPYLLWTGTVEPRKNLRGLLEAFARLEGGHELVLAGPRGWHEDLGRLADRVRRLGFVPADDLPGLYAGAEAFCFPSLMEGFGFPVLEAMAQGTPVVTSRGTSTEELADGAGILVDPHDPAAIADGIGRALAERRRLAEAGPRRAAEYTWERTASLVAEAYDQVSR